MGLMTDYPSSLATARQRDGRAQAVARLRSGATWRATERLHGRGDTEVEQNLIRVAIVLLILLFCGWQGARTGEAVAGAVVTLIAYLGYTLLNFVWIHLSPARSTPRLLASSVGDRGMISAMLAFNGPWASPLYILYVWVDIGNGARFGAKYLYFSTTLSAIGFAGVVAYNDYWRSFGDLTYGLWLGILLAPYYSWLFAKRLRDANVRLEQLATHDTLTQLPNRSFFNERLRDTIAEAERYQRNFAVMFIDIDNFKQINDAQGHAAGDEALRTTARILRQTFRRSDVVARLGGDEFVILLHNVHERSLHRVGEKLRNKLRNDGNQRISASIGVSYYPKCGTDPEALIRHADRALYAVKQAGKGRCALCVELSGAPELAQLQPAAVGLLHG